MTLDADTRTTRGAIAKLVGKMRHPLNAPHIDPNRRLVTAGNGVPAVDINLIPAAAIGRIEVLKDGAAAT